jgi:hypothetical protein
MPLARSPIGVIQRLSYAVADAGLVPIDVVVPSPTGSQTAVICTSGAAINRSNSDSLRAAAVQARVVLSLGRQIQILSTFLGDRERQPATAGPNFATGDIVFGNHPLSFPDPDARRRWRESRTDWHRYPA